MTFPLQELPPRAHITNKMTANINVHVIKEGDIMLSGEALKPSISIPEEISHVKNASQGDIPFSGPLQVSSSSGFAWAKRRKDDSSSVRSRSRSSSRGQPFNESHAKSNFDSKRYENGELSHGTHRNERGHDSWEIAKLVMQKQWGQFERPDSFDGSDGYHSQELSLALYQREEMAAKRNSMVSSQWAENQFSFQTHPYLV